MGEPFFNCQVGCVGCRALCLKSIMGVRDFEENMHRCEEVQTAWNPKKNEGNLYKKDSWRIWKTPPKNISCSFNSLCSLYCSHELFEGGRIMVWFIYKRVRWAHFLAIPQCSLFDAHISVSRAVSYSASMQQRFLPQLKAPYFISFYSALCLLYTFKGFFCSKGFMKI